MEKALDKGKIIAVYGPVVDVQFNPRRLLPGIYETIEVFTYKGQKVVLEIVEHRQNNICRCIALGPTYGLKRNSEAIATGSKLRIPKARNLYGRIVNVMGEAIDGRGEIKIEDAETIAVRRSHETEPIDIAETDGSKFVITETGIKAIDLLFPLVKGSKTGILGGAALGKTILILEIIHNIINKQ